MSTRSLFLTYPFSPDNPLTFSVATFSGRLYLSLKVLFVLSVWFGFLNSWNRLFRALLSSMADFEKACWFLHCRKCRSGAIGLATNWWYQALNCRNCRRFDRLRFCLVRILLLLLLKVRRPLLVFLARVVLAPVDDFVCLRWRWKHPRGWSGSPPEGEEPRIDFTLPVCLASSDLETTLKATCLINWIWWMD